MPSKEDRRKEAVRHTGMVKGLFATEIAQTVESAELYEDGVGRDLPLPEPRFEKTTIKVEWAGIATVASRSYGKVCLLDPANYRIPGGNYLGGGWSPEEQICAESNLFPILEGEGLREIYYDGNKHTGHGGLNSDRALYLKDVIFTTGGIMQKRDVIVCAPPNRRFALENHRSEAECDIDLANRVRTILHIAVLTRLTRWFSTHSAVGSSITIRLRWQVCSRLGSTPIPGSSSVWCSPFRVAPPSTCSARCSHARPRKVRSRQSSTWKTAMTSTTTSTSSRLPKAVGCSNSDNKKAAFGPS